MADTIFPNTQNYLTKQLKDAQLDHDSFEAFIKPCELEKCKGSCCHDGVQLSKEDATIIDQLVEENYDTLTSYGIDLTSPVTQKSSERDGWKTRSVPTTHKQLAEDFPEHFKKTRCVFLDEQHHCALQRLAIELDKPAWYFKPQTCWIHPISIQKNSGRHLLTLVSTKSDPQKTAQYPGYGSCTHCGRYDNTGRPAKDVLVLELNALSKLADRDFLAELNATKVDWY